jgi:NAD(P)-dependent dehydrogenase (short-subunit alcohol dehydrogenase family)
MLKTWLITGASRGLGAHIAKAVLGAGHCVVATGRKRASVIEGLGQDSDRLMTIELDVTDAVQARAAIDAAVARFGAIDVLVNNAGYGQMGFFEETTEQDVRDQFDTNLFGVFNVTRAALPVMRANGKGRIFNLSSLGGLLGAEMGSLYCASKFALEGFSECLAKEVAAFGLFVTIVEPGPFRTEFLTSNSTRFGQTTVAAYDARRAQIKASMDQRNGRQPGDPARLAQAMVRLADEAEPPLRFLAGCIAVDAADAKLARMREEIKNWRELSVSTDGDFTRTSVGSLLEQIK